MIGMKIYDQNGKIVHDHQKQSTTVFKAWTVFGRQLTYETIVLTNGTRKDIADRYNIRGVILTNGRRQKRKRFSRNRDDLIPRYPETRAGSHGSVASEKREATNNYEQYERFTGQPQEGAVIDEWTLPRREESPFPGRRSKARYRIDDNGFPTKACEEQLPDVDCSGEKAGSAIWNFCIMERDGTAVIGDRSRKPREDVNFSGTKSFGDRTFPPLPPTDTVTRHDKKPPMALASRKSATDLTSSTKGNVGKSERNPFIVGDSLPTEVIRRHASGSLQTNPCADPEDEEADVDEDFGAPDEYNQNDNRSNGCHVTAVNTVSTSATSDAESFSTSITTRRKASIPVRTYVVLIF